MSRSFEDVLEPYHRYLILEFLTRCNASTSNNQLVQLWLEHIGAGMCLEAIKIHTYWLSEHQLITRRPVDDTLEVYALTRHGHEVVRGITHMPGIWHSAS